VIEDDHLVRKRDRGQPVRDDERRAPLHRLAQAEPDARLGRRVDGGGRVVEDEDARVHDDRACDCDPLALPARERDAALAHDRLVAVRKVGDELVRLREPGGRFDLLVGRRRGTKGDVLAHRGREEERILRDDRHLRAE
jgi:hypothetical protein